MPRLLFHPSIFLAALLTLAPFFSAAFWPRSLQLAQQWPLRLRILAPALLGLPYALVSSSTGLFRWSWLALYTLLPVLISLLLYQASLADPDSKESGRTSLSLPS